MTAVPFVLRTPKRVFLPFTVAAIFLGWDCLLGWMLAPLFLVLLLLYRAGQSGPEEDVVTLWDGVFLGVCGWQVLLTCRTGVAIVEGVSPFASFDWLARAALEHPARVIPLLLLPALVIHGLLRQQVQQFRVCRTRFTVDIRPSLQMEVDDNTVCGLWCAGKAQQRREEIEREQNLLQTTNFYNRVLVVLNGLAVGAALLCLLAGAAWRCLGQGSTIASAMAACAPSAIGLALILPLSNLLLCLATGWSLSLRSVFLERWESAPVTPSQRPPWLWCLVGLMGWCDLEGLMLGLVVLCGLLLVIHLAQQDFEHPLDSPFPIWHKAAFVVHSWQLIFLGCSSLAVLFSTSQAQTPEQLGRVILDSHPRLLPLLCLPLLLAHYRVHCQTQRIGFWNARFSLDSVPGIQMAIEMDRLNGSQTQWRARVHRDRLEQEADLLDWVAIQMSRTRRVGQLSLLVIAACLLGATTWRCLVLGQDAASACSASAWPLLASALTLSTSGLLFTTALELRLASPFLYLKKDSSAPLAEHGEVKKMLGGVSAEIGMAWLGLPLGLSLVVYTFWRCRPRTLPTADLHHNWY